MSKDSTGSEPYIHERQPDYGSWPTDDFYIPKREMLNRIESDYNTTGTIRPESLEYLIHKATNFWQLFEFMSKYRIEIQAEIFAKDFEISDLKRQLEEKA
jgi:hypothetical protein